MGIQARVKRYNDRMADPSDPYVVLVLYDSSRGSHVIMARLFFDLFAGEVKEVGELVRSCIYTTQLGGLGVKAPHSSSSPPRVDKLVMPI